MFTCVFIAIIFLIKFVKASRSLNLLVFYYFERAKQVSRVTTSTRANGTRGANHDTPIVIEYAITPLKISV